MESCPLLCVWSKTRTRTGWYHSLAVTGSTHVSMTCRFHDGYSGEVLQYDSGVLKVGTPLWELAALRCLVRKGGATGPLLTSKAWL